MRSSEFCPRRTSHVAHYTITPHKMGVSTITPIFTISYWFRTFTYASYPKNFIIARLVFCSREGHMLVLPPLGYDHEDKRCISFIFNHFWQTPSFVTYIWINNLHKNCFMLNIKIQFSTSFVKNEKRWHFSSHWVLRLERGEWTLGNFGCFYIYIFMISFKFKSGGYRHI